MESYMHYYAKEVLQQWLISAWKYNRQHKYSNKLYIFEWKIDCRDSNYGIRLEYPILSRRSEAGTQVLGVNPVWVDYPDITKGDPDIKVEAVLDLAIVEDGHLKYGLEVVHKHVCPQSKRTFIQKHLCDVPVYEISAEWILSQVKSDVPPKMWPVFKI